MSFNRTPISSLYAIAQSVKTPVPSSYIGDRDRFPSWQFITKEPEPEGERKGERWLLRNGCSGLVWVHVNEEKMTDGYSLVVNEEARKLWPRLILQFRPAEVEALEQALQPQSHLSRGIETALGGTALLQGEWLDDQPADDGTVLRHMVVHLRGIVRAWVSQSDREKIVRAELVTGEEAWKLIRPFIDS